MSEKSLNIDKTFLKRSAKKNLKTMQRSSHYHPLRERGRIFKYGISGFARNIWLSSAATIVMVITLIILFITIVASVILTDTAELMREKIDITVYLRPGTSETVLSKLTNIISKDSNVKSVETSTSKQEYAKFLSENANKKEVMAILADKDMEKNMISHMQAIMRIKVKNVNDLSGVKNIVETDDEFKEYLDVEKSPTYDVNRVEISTITSWANIARTGGIVLGTVFLVISILIIFSTIRMAIFSRREEIYMMKLVGAGKHFIRGPFLVEAEICGIISGIIAATISSFGFSFLAPKLTNFGIDISSISNFLDPSRLVLVYTAFIIVGILIGFFSARLAISKYINKA